MSDNRPIVGNRGRVISCCKDCKDRWVDIENSTNCHSHCEKYKAFQEVSSALELIREEEQNKNYTSQAAVRAQKRNMYRHPKMNRTKR